MITLEEAKHHLRVIHDDEDAAIQAMIGTALAATADYMNWTPDQMADPATVPAPVKSAMLLIVGDLYMNRELQADKQLFANRTYERLLNPYRLMAV
ncbi:hypothetical protein N879_07010 [Alcaligenes sp. EGD-AK7]|uniref:head-tail connector protein n=1 Tax=Alcaligenes sp. EGD-AK7 TaxID=1386079 RepID=UPI0002AA72B6|nr:MULTISPECIES: head-tail connector protein [unclassified Alcaligenes]EKU30770.1 phage protein DNA packaging protein [Alcaligenes sp. HPC1271]ERI33583.1 hypothetical protein N879_07010 [Alcaligenes sp. EGD-AK7]